MNITISHPCPDFPITQGFGENPAAYARFGMDGHNGIDFGTPPDTPLRACFGGHIEKVAVATGGYGLHVMIRHSCFFSIYAHLNEFTLPIGEWVARDQVIAQSGGQPGHPNAGNTTGPHLHFEIRPFLGGLTAFGGAIDPAPLIAVPTNSNRALVIASYLNIRKGPSVNTPVIGTVKHGTRVEVLDTEGNWVRIDQPRKGWINRQFIQFLP